MSSKNLTVNFRSKVDKIGSRLIIKLPPDASAKLPSRGQVAVSGTINAREFKTVIEPDGNKGHWISVDGKMGQLKAGEHVKIEIEPVKKMAGTRCSGRPQKSPVGRQRDY